MSAPKPWERTQTKLNSTNNTNDIIARSGEEISANPQALATNAANTGNTSTVHKSPESSNTADTSTPNTTSTTGNYDF